MNDLIGKNQELEAKLGLYEGVNEEMNKQVCIKHAIQGVKNVRRMDVPRHTALEWVEVHAPAYVYNSCLRTFSWTFQHNY